MQPSLKSLTDKSVSHAWLGHSSALFLELGVLSEKKRNDGSTGNPIGEITIIVDFGWHIERPQSILCGSGESKSRMATALRGLLGTSIISCHTTGRIPELQIEFSNNLWLVTFSQYQGQPTWAVLFNSPGLGALDVKRGKLFVEKIKNRP